MDFRGDPSSALLEVLDPEQNNSFQDNYLEVPFDLSQGPVHRDREHGRHHPPALRDRMEIIQLPGYTAARESCGSPSSFLVPKQLENHGLTAEQLTFERSGAGAHDPGLHPGGRGPQRGARDRLDLAQGRPQGRRRRLRPRSVVTPESTSRSTSARPASTTGSWTRRTRSAWPPGWWSATPAATSCRSRRPRWTARTSSS